MWSPRARVDAASRDERRSITTASARRILRVPQILTAIFPEILAALS